MADRDRTLGLTKIESARRGSSEGAHGGCGDFRTWRVDRVDVGTDTRDVQSVRFVCLFSSQAVRQ